jgi:hypothetical protein
VINLDDFRDHVMLKTVDGMIEIFPVSMLEKLINGTMLISGIPRGEIIARSIMQDWLARVTVEL